MSDCTHTRTRYVRVHRNNETSLSVQCTECGQLLKLKEHHYRFLIKQFEIPVGAEIVDIDYSEVTRHGN